MPWPPTFRAGAVAIGVRLEALFRPAAESRRTNNLPNQTGKLPVCTEAARTRDQVGAAVGVSGKTYEKAKAVVQAAQEDPEKYGKLAENMDKSGKVDRAYKAVKQVQKAEQRAEQAAQITVDPALIFGDFRIVGADLQDECADLVFTDPPYDEDPFSDE